MNGKSRVMNALYAKALADKEKALMALDLLENKAVGIGDHTADDFFKDAEKALDLFISANERLITIDNYFDFQKEIEGPPFE